MAEFCFLCWNKINGTDDQEEDYIISDEPDFCEECGQWKPVVIKKKPRVHSIFDWWKNLFNEY